MDKNSSRIVINDVKQASTGIKFRQASLTKTGTTKITGSVECKLADCGRNVIVGAYALKNKKVVQIAADCFNMQDTVCSYQIEFNDNKSDCYYLYADFIGGDKTLSSQDDNIAVFNVNNKLKRAVEVDELSFKLSRITLDNIGFKRKNRNITMYLESSSQEEIGPIVFIKVVVYDYNGDIADIQDAWFETGFTHMIEELEFNFNPSKIEKIKIIAENQGN